MSTLNIGIILGSTRPGRNGAAVADWILEQAASRSANYALIDLADYPLPHLDEPMPPSLGQYSHEHTRAWSEVVSAQDGFIFVTPEYNHSISGVLKNALDYLYTEWNNKAVGIASYGALGGARAAEHLRSIAGELQLADVRQQLAFSFFTDFQNFRDFTPADLHVGLAQTMFDQVEAWSAALKTLRSGDRGIA